MFPSNQLFGNIGSQINFFLQSRAISKAKATSKEASISQSCGTSQAIRSTKMALAVVCPKMKAPRVTINVP